MEIWRINGYTLEYDDENHVYIVDGVIVPSVTQILGAKFGNKYANVNRSTLERAANRGTEIHKAIEMYCRTGADAQLKELRNFRFLKTYYGLDIQENEVPVILSLEDTPIAAGRLDLVFEIYGEMAIADIKTTSVLDKDYLAYQLNLYRLAYMQSYSRNITKLYGVHLKDDKRKLVNIPINEGLAWNLVKEYKGGKE